MADNPLHEELLREARAATRIDKERAEVLEAFVKTPGWKLYEELLENRIQSLGSEVLEPAGSLDGAIALEHVKGTLKGLILARDLPSVILGATKDFSPASGDGAT